MIQKIISVLLGTLLTGFTMVAQTEPEITVSFLANDKIADINIDQEKYIKNSGELIDLVKKTFKEIPTDQKIAILIISHKTGRPTIQIFSKPALNADKEQQFLKTANDLSFENTKLVDFLIIFHVNVKNAEAGNEFKDIILPMHKVKTEYESADLKTKYELNKTWALDEVLPVLCTYQVIVDEKFLGVKNFGTLGKKTDFRITQNISAITNTNPDYWRAVLEMNIGNQLIPATKIFMHVSQGEFDYAMKWLEIVGMFSDTKTTANDYLDELSWRLKLFNEQLNASINKGIEEHDKGNYQKAIIVYSNILNSYPNSAWALYEQYYSQNALDIKNKKIELADRHNWDNAKSNIYKCNPLYNMDVRASNAREGYLLFRRQEIAGLFKGKADRLDDIYKYADIAMDLGIYDFAAQLFWYSFVYSKAENDRSLKRFLYCIEKSGVTNLKQNFKGDFEKEFKKIDDDKEKEMKENAFYKSFKE